MIECLNSRFQARISVFRALRFFNQVWPRISQFHWFKKKNYFGWWSTILKKDLFPRKLILKSWMNLKSRFLTLIPLLKAELGFFNFRWIRTPQEWSEISWTSTKKLKINVLFGQIWIMALKNVYNANQIKFFYPLRVCVMISVRSDTKTCRIFAWNV